MPGTFKGKTFASKTFACGTFAGAGVTPPPAGGKRTFFCDTFASKTFACATFRGAGSVPPPPTNLGRGGRWSPPGRYSGRIPAARTLLADLFAGAAGASIDARPMTTGPGWSIASGGNAGGWVIDSGRARETGTLPITSSVAVSDAGAGDGTVYGTLTVPAITGDSAIGMLARMSADFQNGWLGWVDVFDQRIVISERTSGFFVPRAQLAASLSYGRDYALSFRCVGSSLTLTVAGVGAVSYTSSANMANTRWGVYGDSAPGQFVSDFSFAGAPETPAACWSPVGSDMAAEPIRKDSGDALTYEMNFGFQPEVRAGRTISSCTVTAAVMNSGSGTVTAGAATVAHPLVLVQLSGGTAGNRYLVTFTATYDNGQTRVLRGILEVVNT